MRLSIRASPVLRARSSPVPFIQPFAPPKAPPVFKQRFITGVKVVKFNPEAHHEPLIPKLGCDTGFRYWPPGRATETVTTVLETVAGDDSATGTKKRRIKTPKCIFGPNFKIDPSFARFDTTKPTGRNAASPEGVKIAVAKLFDLPIRDDNSGVLFIQPPPTVYPTPDEDFRTPASGEGFEKVLISFQDDFGGGWPLKYHVRNPYNLPALAADGPFDAYFGSAKERAEARSTVESSRTGARGTEEFSDKATVVEKEGTFAAMQRLAAEYDAEVAKLQSNNAHTPKPPIPSTTTEPTPGPVPSKARPAPTQSESALGGVAEDRPKPRKSPMRRPRVGDVM